MIVTDGLYEKAIEARDFIRSRSVALAGVGDPRVGVVLGSGLGGFADRVENQLSIAYAEIPHFPRSTVIGHSGRLLLGGVAGVPVAVMQGRIHGYEGYAPAEVGFPMRVLRGLGVHTVIVTNAAGGIRPSYHEGQLVTISDHINFTGANPLTGPNEERFGQRFFDMTEAYSKRLRAIAAEAGREVGLDLPEGIYLGLSGPNFETPAEIRAFRTLGADLVGMSTVHEVIVARHMAMEVLGISCVTNMAAGVLEAPLDHEEVLVTVRRVEADFARLLTAIVKRLL